MRTYILKTLAVVCGWYYTRRHRGIYAQGFCCCCMLCVSSVDKTQEYVYFVCMHGPYMCGGVQVWIRAALCRAILRARDEIRGNSICSRAYYIDWFPSVCVSM